MAGAQDVPAPGAPAMPGPPPAAGSAAPAARPCAGGPAAGESKGQGKGDQGLPPAANGAQGAGRRPGWCAKVVIQADLLHQEFPTVTKIVGVGNANVDHIRGQTQCSVILRGKGSGHVEAETGQESSEPMFLWLSSDLPQNGKSALEMVQDP
ncbi:unnamed protein product [Prorocentrum cordatum]|uniref:KHDC4/BBP-like KH-domain type I domain-containing protein n=1 Tax=Prorocentrum cordatum TaxID=2364126 RepID=A0ABN9WX02_9DINO|nr:unnamed protein product [Polarella glacialis]